MRIMADNPEIFVKSRTPASVARTEGLRLAAGDPRASDGNKVEHHLPDHSQSVEVCLARSGLARLVGSPGESQTLSFPRYLQMLRIIRWG
jgi:hypothetical protein